MQVILESTPSILVLTLDEKREGGSNRNICQTKWTCTFMINWAKKAFMQDCSYVAVKYLARLIFK